MTKPHTNWRTFLHWCHGCGNVLLPYGNRCDCGRTDQMPAHRIGQSMRPWHQLATMTLVRVGKAVLCAHYTVDNKAVRVTRVDGRGKPDIKIRPYYVRQIESSISKAEGVL